MELPLTILGTYAEHDSVLIQYGNVPPPGVVDDFKQTLLGRLKLLLLQDIAKTTERFPTTEEVRDFLLKETSREKSLVSLFTCILNEHIYSVIDTPYSIEEVKIESILDELSILSLPKRYFSELKHYPTSTGSTGIVITRTTNLESITYNVFFVSDQSFPGFLAGHVGVSVSQNQASISVLMEEGGYRYFDRGGLLSASIESIPTSLKLAIVALERFCRDFKPKLVDTKMVERSNPRKTRNRRLEGLIRDAMLGKIDVSLVHLPLNKIKVIDFEPCLSADRRIIEAIIDQFESGMRHDLLLYWDGSHFVMDDDHVLYLSYKALGLSEVSAAVVGAFPTGEAKVVLTGGKELIPPAGAIQKGQTLQISNPEEVLELRAIGIRNSLKGDASHSLHEIYIDLYLLLQKPKLKERQIHDFFHRHSTALDAYGSNILSEVILPSDDGKQKHRIDLALQYFGVDKRVVLFELERSDLKLFTKSGNLTHELNHATRQVEDWMQFWQENSHLVPEPFDKTLPVEGMVVIGRSTTLSDKEKRRLVHINSGRKVKVITYDDLLERINLLARNLDKR